MWLAVFSVGMPECIDHSALLQWFLFFLRVLWTLYLLLYLSVHDVVHCEGLILIAVRFWQASTSMFDCEDRNGCGIEEFTGSCNHRESHCKSRKERKWKKRSGRKTKKLFGMSFVFPERQIINSAKMSDLFVVLVSHQIINGCLSYCPPERGGIGFKLSMLSYLCDSGHKYFHFKRMRSQVVQTNVVWISHCLGCVHILL